MICCFYFRCMVCFVNLGRIVPRCSMNFCRDFLSWLLMLRLRLYCFSLFYQFRANVIVVVDAATVSCKQFIICDASASVAHHSDIVDSLTSVTSLFSTLVAHCFSSLALPLQSLCTTLMFRLWPFYSLHHLRHSTDSRACGQLFFRFPASASWRRASGIRQMCYWQCFKRYSLFFAFNGAVFPLMRRQPFSLKWSGKCSGGFTV